MYAHENIYYAYAYFHYPHHHTKHFFLYHVVMLRTVGHPNTFNTNELIYHNVLHHQTNVI